MNEMGVDAIAILLRKIEDLERRVRRMIVFGTVTDVDHERGLVRMTDGMKDDDGEEMKTDWLPWAEHAGKIKTRTMPSVGQQVTLFSPSGTMEQGIVSIGWYNENNKMPEAKGGEHVFINGTHYKQVITNGPGASAGGGDGSDSTAGKQAKTAQTDTKNKGAKDQIQRVRYGKLSDDEGSWGDGKSQTKPQGDDSTATEFSYDENQTTVYAEKGGEKSIRTQTATQVQTKVGDASVRTQTKAEVDDKVGGSSEKITGSGVTHVGTASVSHQAPRVEDVGKSYLGLKSPGEEPPKKMVGEGLVDAPRVLVNLDDAPPDPKVVAMDAAIAAAGSGGGGGGGGGGGSA